LKNFELTTWLVVLAFLVFVVRIKKIRGWEWAIFLIIALNCIADLLVPYMRDIFQKDYGSGVYNGLAIVQRTLTLLLYASNTRVKEERYLNYGALGLLILVNIGAGFYYPDFFTLYTFPYIFLGLVVAFCSYIHLRNMVLEKTGASVVIGAFSLANFVYLTLMVSSVSAISLAYSIDHDFGRLIYALGNHAGYCLWSIILIISIIWKK